jgi:tRNA-binding EMAP/Myf-like protein
MEFFVFVFPSVMFALTCVFAFCYPLQQDKKRIKNRKAFRVYKKGMVLRMKTENPFDKQRYIYVVDVLKNDDGVMYMKVVDCDENGDCDVDNDSDFNVGKGYEYLKDGWLPYKFK